MRVQLAYVRVHKIPNGACDYLVVLPHYRKQDPRSIAKQTKYEITYKITNNSGVNMDKCICGFMFTRTTGGRVGSIATTIDIHVPSKPGLGSVYEIGIHQERPYGQEKAPPSDPSRTATPTVPVRLLCVIVYTYRAPWPFVPVTDVARRTQ